MAGEEGGEGGNLNEMDFKREINERRKISGEEEDYYIVRVSRLLTTT